MGKGGKLTKLKSALKKWPSFTKLDRKNGNSVDGEEYSADAAGNFHPVNVGKSCRRYLVSSEVVHHPLFRVLVDELDGSDGVAVACEVVLFEHLLWMLENADSPLESVDELVEFYRY